MNPDFTEANLGLTPRAAEPPAAAPAGTPTFEQLFPAEHGRLAAAEQHLRDLEPRLQKLETDAAQWVDMITRAAESPAMSGVLRMLGIKLP
jgi:hypothetical protein